MHRRLRALLLVLAAVVLFAACQPLNFQNVNDLMRAPALAPGQGGEIQQALAAALGEEPQYKFPREGDRLTPLILADLDGDGLEEALLFYTYSQASNACIALLAQREGQWVFLQEFEGKNSEVASVDVVDMWGDGSLQLAVGYAASNLSSKNLMFYRFREGSFIEISYPREYLRYLSGDFTGRGTTSIAVAALEDPGGTGQQQLTIRFLVASGDNIENLQDDPIRLDRNITDCLGIYIGQNAEGQRQLILDCLHANNMLVSLVLLQQESGAGFYIREDAPDMMNETARDVTFLLARDISGNGRVEIPVDKQVVSNELRGDNRLSWLWWRDYSEPEFVPVQFGILDGNLGIYIRLPDAWERRLSASDGQADGEWTLRNSPNNAPLLSLRVVEEGAAPPANGMAVPGYSNVWLQFYTGVSALDRQSITVTSLR